MEENFVYQIVEPKEWHGDVKMIKDSDLAEAQKIMNNKIKEFGYTAAFNDKNEIVLSKKGSNGNLKKAIATIKNLF